MSPPSVPVGFNYSMALLAIRKHRTYEEIAAYLGYDSVGAIGKVIQGSVPSHPVGEAIYVLYRELFGTKPPMSSSQATGIQDLHPSACCISPSSV